MERREKIALFLSAIGGIWAIIFALTNVFVEKSAAAAAMFIPIIFVIIIGLCGIVAAFLIQTRKDKKMVALFLAVGIIINIIYGLYSEWYLLTSIVNVTNLFYLAAILLTVKKSRRG